MERRERPANGHRTSGRKEAGKKENPNRKGVVKKKDLMWKGDGKKEDFIRKIASGIVDRFGMEKMTGSSGNRNADIMALAGGRKEAVREYHIEKVRNFLILSVFALVAAAFILIISFTEDRSVPEGKIARPGYGEGSSTEELEVKIDDYGSVSDDSDEILRKGTILSMEIQDRQYTDEQKKLLLEKAEEELREVFLGENPSQDAVTQKVNLPTVLAGGAVHVEWTAMPYGILGEDGTPEEGIPEEGTVVTMEAELSVQGLHRVTTAAIKVFPPQMTAREEAHDVLTKEADRINAGSKNEDYYLLPQQIGGKRLIWMYPYNTDLPVLAIILLSIPFLVSALADQRVHKAAQRRRDQLELDYPDLLWKMTLLIGAGMNLSSAFSRVAEDYRKEIRIKNAEVQNRKRILKFWDKKQIDNKRYVYEEMLITCHEIRDGLSEGKAYEQFGHRCGLPRYIRLGSVLSQNLRKGSKGLTELLEQEALSASRERQSQARKLGEKAGTKLLLPMVMMLCIVFVILVVPAFMSM